MTLHQITHTLTETVEELSSLNSLQGVFHEHKDGDPLPSQKHFARLSNCVALSYSRGSMVSLP